MNVDTSKWSGEGEFTQLLLEHLRQVPGLPAFASRTLLRARSEADYNFISNEFFVDFATEARQERAQVGVLLPVSPHR